MASLVTDSVVYFFLFLFLSIFLVLMRYDDVMTIVSFVFRLSFSVVCVS